MPRYFTLDEARASLAELRDVLRELQALKRGLDALNAPPANEVATVRGNGHRPPAGQGQPDPEVQRLVAAIEAGIRRITETGCQLKDIDAGLLDWPSLRDGREVYLCWRTGEPDVLYWHEIADGFAGRQRL